jgi:hypothetical protein
MPTISTLTVEVDAKTQKFTTGTKVALGGLAALGAGAAYAFGQFEDAQKVSNQTAAVLTSTGGAANVTAQQIDDLSQSLSEKSGIDDEVIQSGENMILTFTNIRNEAGKGNDIFNQATVAATDMAAAMAAASGGQIDLKGATIQLGKALNDPVKGITALTRVGVAFTDQQKKQITALVKSGDTLGAQKIILGEVTKEFGGSAKANATSSMKMKVAVGNLAEAVGGVLAPAINVVVGALTTFIAVLTRFPAAFVLVAAAVAAVTVALIANNVATALAAEEGVVYAAVLAAKTAAHLAQAAATGVATAAQWLFNAAVEANPIGLIIIAIVAAIAVIVLLVRHFHLASKVMDALKKTVSVVWGFIQAYVRTVVGLVVGYIKIWIAIIQTVGHVAADVGHGIISVFGKVVSFFRGLPGVLARAGAGMWDWIVDTLRNAVNAVVGLLNTVIDHINAFQIHVHIDPPGPGSVNFDWSGLGIPHIPSLATGGLVGRTGLAVVHEGERWSGVGNDRRGSRQMILHLDRKRFLDTMAYDATYGDGF